MTFELPFKRAFCRSSERPEIHGGVTAALIDIAGDYAIVAKLGGLGVPTIDLRIDYLRMAVETTLTAKATAVKVGRTLGVVNVEVSDDDGAARRHRPGHVLRQTVSCARASQAGQSNEANETRKQRGGAG